MNLFHEFFKSKYRIRIEKRILAFNEELNVVVEMKKDKTLTRDTKEHCSLIIKEADLICKILLLKELLLNEKAKQ
jgi:hypothetical protein